MQHHVIGHARRALGGIVLLGSTLALAACGGGSSSGGSGTGLLTLGITDAKVDTAQAVNVVFTGVMLKPEDGEAITFLCSDPEFDCDDPDADSDGFPDNDVNGDGFGDYRMIDLLTLTGDESETLLDAVELDAGRYDWIRLLVNAKGPGASGQFDGTIPLTNIVLEVGGDMEDLLVPGGRTGLKLVSGFVVPSGGAASFTIDFDLRKAVTLSAVGYKLRPALRLIDNSTSGHLIGEITSNFVTTECAGDDTGGIAVYVYEGNGATTGDLGDPDNEPLTTDRAEMAPDGNYDYEIGFLAAGDYTAAVTCEAISDTDADESLAFVATTNVPVSEGPEPTVLDFD